jgi:hypothetical protein
MTPFTKDEKRNGVVDALKGVENYLRLLLQHEIMDSLKTDPRFNEPKRLLKYAVKRHSQGGEDGILTEIFRRIGADDQCFIEFGVGDGKVTNTIGLLHDGWHGVWIEGSEGHAKLAKDRHKAVGVQFGLVTPDNADKTIVKHARHLTGGDRLDLLSIDVDGCDYWVWKAIETVRPRVVVIEYNALWAPGYRKTVPPSEDLGSHSTNYFGASLSALEALGWKKGYRLVGCTPTGVNAFFVRSEDVGDKFCAPFTAENHYEPPRYALAEWSGYPPGDGEWVDV